VAADQEARARRLAALNAELTAALERLEALRTTPGDDERRRVWARINGIAPPERTPSH
jgi:hypothetical protein